MMIDDDDTDDDNACMQASKQARSSSKFSPPSSNYLTTHQTHTTSPKTVSLCSIRDQHFIFFGPPLNEVSTNQTKPKPSQAKPKARRGGVGRLRREASLPSSLLQLPHPPTLLLFLGLLTYTPYQKSHHIQQFKMFC
jgi:hypothetical protein